MSCRRRTDTATVGRIEARKTIIDTQLSAPNWVPGLSRSSTTPNTTLTMTTASVQYQYSGRVARPPKSTYLRKFKLIASGKVMNASIIRFRRRSGPWTIWRLPLEGNNHNLSSRYDLSATSGWRLLLCAGEQPQRLTQALSIELTRRPQ